jgi:hypothetical protein
MRRRSLFFILYLKFLFGKSAQHLWSRKPGKKPGNGLVKDPSILGRTFHHILKPMAHLQGKIYADLHSVKQAVSLF